MASLSCFIYCSSYKLTGKISPVSKLYNSISPLFEIKPYDFL